MRYMCLRFDIADAGEPFTHLLVEQRQIPAHIGKRILEHRSPSLYAVVVAIAPMVAV